GYFVHWSGDAKSLHWVLGPELHTRALDDVFAFLDGSKPQPEPPQDGADKPEPPKPEIEAVNVGFSVDADVPTGKLALVGGKLVTMKGDEVIADGTIVIDQNRIVAIGPRDQVQIPQGAKQI